MKKASQVIWNKYPPVRFHLEDLSHLAEILKQTGDVTAVKYVVGGFEYDSLDEIMSLGRDELKELTIASERSKPSWPISILIQPATVYIQTYDDSLSTRAVIQDIEEHFGEHSRPYFRWHRRWEMRLYALAAGGFMLAVLGHNSTSWMWITGYCIVIAWAIYFLFDRLWAANRQSLIVLKSRRESSSFWARNRDALIRGMIIAAVGAVLGVIGTILTQRIITTGP